MGDIDADNKDGDEEDDDDDEAEDDESGGSIDVGGGPVTTGVHYSDFADYNQDLNSLYSDGRGGWRCVWISGQQCHCTQCEETQSISFSKGDRSVKITMNDNPQHSQKPFEMATGIEKSSVNPCTATHPIRNQLTTTTSIRNTSTKLRKLLTKERRIQLLKERRAKRDAKSRRQIDRQVAAQARREETAHDKNALQFSGWGVDHGYRCRFLWCQNWDSRKSCR